MNNTLEVAEINSNLMAAIRNLMDDELAEQAADEFPETESEFIMEYLKLDPDFEDVLKSEFNIEM